jgi:hypothetical protein
VELLIVLVMLAIGGGVAAAIGVTFAAAQREAEMNGTRTTTTPDRHHLAASLLFHVLLAGGTAPDAAMREIRRTAGLAAPVTSAIDVTSWGERYARIATPEQRMWLLDIAVQLVANRTTPVPLRQYSALLDLSFSLGFQTDALAKLRDVYGFDYVDHAKNARPRSADRAGGATTLFARDRRDPAELLVILGIEPATATRAIIISAYRRLATQHHPDKVYAEPPEVQSAAAARFIEITRAYETLLAIYDE